MNYDLKIIKKKYGEKMSKLCRELFPTLLEQEGLLSNLILNNFEPNHKLYDDILKDDKKWAFKNYIYSLVDVEDNYKIELTKTPEELLSEAGYILYPECKCEKDIQKFKKYYSKEEVLCTFNGKRLKRCRVFFAIKKDIDKIKREDFKNPKREDLYGTSVISIQFTKDKSNTLSIKNRYNHTVNNPDNTYLNNLDNIIPGLTKSFEKYYGIVQKNINFDFELPNYVKVGGKYYKYNYEINNIYYGTNNIIIDNYEVKKYPKEKYIILDYFILDLINKKLKLYDEAISETFPDIIDKIDKIKIENRECERQINIITKTKKEIELIINSENQIIKLKSDDIMITNNYFMTYNNTIENIDLKNLEVIGSYFLSNNNKIKNITFPNAKIIWNNFLYKNNSIEKISMPKVEFIAPSFLGENKSLKKINLENVKIIKYNFMPYNLKLNEINLPQVKKIEDNFLFRNNTLKKISLPNVKIIEDYFMFFNRKLENIYLPKIEKIGEEFLWTNHREKEKILSKLKKNKNLKLKK